MTSLSQSPQIALDYLRDNGPSRAVDVGQAVLDAGMTSCEKPSVVGSDVCRKLMRYGIVAKIRRGVYELRLPDAGNDAMIGIPHLGGLSAGRLNRVRRIAAAYGRELVAAHDEAAGALEEYLAGCHNEISRQVVMMDLVLEEAGR